MEELVRSYQEFRNGEPTELELKVIRERFQSINEEIREKLARPRSSLNSGHFDISSLTNPSAIEDEIRRREERDAHDWQKELDEEHIRIDILSESKKNYEQELELKSGSFPRHITFGYMSQVAFAILGVAFPLIYGSWSGYLGDNSNIVAIVLFIIGLATTFAYIISEVWAATHQ